MHVHRPTGRLTRSVPVQYYVFDLLHRGDQPLLNQPYVQRRALLEQLLARVGAGAWIEPPFFCDYGWNVTLGDGAFLNFNCVILDCAAVEIGERTLLGPAVQLCAATHPVDPAERATGLENAKPITIGRNVWIGAGAIVGAGVTIGDDSVVGAGSIVLRDVPASVLAAGNPCRVIRTLP